MKKTILFSLIIAITLAFSSCGKYEEGPEFSLLTKKARLTGTWVQTEQTINGTSIDLGLTTVKYTFDKDGTGNLYTKTSVLITVETNTPLEWKFDDTKENLMIKTEGVSDFTSSEIIRLSSSELWIRVINGGITTITKFEIEK